MTPPKPVVLLIFGGDSPEHDVSLASATNVHDALDHEKYEVLLAYVDKQRTWHKVDEVAPHPEAPVISLQEHAITLPGGRTIGVDVALPLIHGVYGEDGVLQAELDQAGIPYAGSDAAASARAFDKVKLKERLEEHGMLTPNWEVVDQTSFATSDLSRRPYVLKPIAGGSSIDTYVVHNPARQTTDFSDAFERHGAMLLEELIIGQEITVGVFDDTALPVILIIPPTGEEFDYDNKYNGRSQEIVAPSAVPPELADRAQALAAHIHRLSGLRHLSRVDMIITPDGAVYTLECNTMPGLTAQSLLPKAAAAQGSSMSVLVDRLIAMALEGAAR